MAYGQKQKKYIGRTGYPFSATFDSNCDLGGDTIDADEEIVMADGEAVHAQCARDAGWEVPK